MNKFKALNNTQLQKQGNIQHANTFQNVISEKLGNFALLNGLSLYFMRKGTLNN